jgi:hypothetical protein
MAQRVNRRRVLIASALITGVIGVLLVCGCIAPPNEPGNATNDSLRNTTPQLTPTPPLQEAAMIRIGVVKFEPTNPCQSCTLLGNYAKETIELYFKEEYESGIMRYETVNYQDPSNIERVRKYGVSGSALFITVIRDGEEEIIGANDMWGYIGSREEYQRVFKGKLEAVLKG